MTVFADTQTSSDQLAVLENVRRRDREKKARQRQAKKEEIGTAVPGDVPGDGCPGDNTGQDRRGEDRPVQAQKENVGDWPPVRAAGSTGAADTSNRGPAGTVRPSDKAVLDDFHPNNAGHAAIAKAILAGLDVR